ncbi:MAG: hypothetical protein HYY84_09870 [Deltaproteobacteria bacterium]|nr:hypothetical protein [Deltaproteobacteria bacterium]
MKTNHRKTRVSVVVSFAVVGAACGGVEGDEPEVAAVMEEPLSSPNATLMNFEYNGELVTTSGASSVAAAKSQAFYLVGHFNEIGGVARVGRTSVSNVKTYALAGGLKRATFRVKIPVVWPGKTNLPSSYSITLPKRVDLPGQTAFHARYSLTCNDAYEPDQIKVANYWYHYRTKASGCTLAAADVTTTTASAVVSTENTVAKFPEYHRIWEDNQFNVVTVWGKYEQGATANDDAGIAAYNRFLREMKIYLPGATISPANLPDDPGDSAREVVFTKELANGRRISVVAILTDELKSEGAAFDKRYNEVSTGADLIAYSGHAGLGSNIAALTQKGRWFPGKYQVFFMNGCDTFAYDNDAMFNVRKALDPARDPTGTKNADVIMNAMPAYFQDMAQGTMAILRALADDANPRHYGQFLADIAGVQVPLVIGETDNVFSPVNRPVIKWKGLAKSDSVGKSQRIDYTTESLAPGTYVFELTPDFATPAGDADLYIRVGRAPSISSTYKCQSYKWNTNERCRITLNASSIVYASVVGDSQKVAPFFVRGFSN